MNRAQIGVAVGALATVGLLLWWSRPAPRVATVMAAVQPGTPVAVQTRPLASSLANQTACPGSFVTHRLPFATGTRSREISTYVSNGAGVAVNDLDDDGD